MFTGRAAIPALESNGVRALVRLGFAKEGKSYSGTYKALRAAITPECEMNCAWLARMHRLLRTHGQELCKNSRPICDACPLEKGLRIRATGREALTDVDARAISLLGVRP